MREEIRWVCERRRMRRDYMGGRGVLDEQRKASERRCLDERRNVDERRE